MSQPEIASGLAAENTTDESLPLSIGISRADSLPEIAPEDAHELCKLKLSDGDFHTKATVNG